MALIQPSIVNWYGGKFALSRQIISMMPEHNHYVEVFMGSGAVFFSKEKAPLNCLNDLNGNLVNLFIQVRDNFDALAEKIYWTLYSRDQYLIFKKQLQTGGIYKLSDLDRAVAYFTIVRQSFGGGVEFGFKTAVHWRYSLIEKMKAARDKLENVMIENLSFEKIIQKYGKYSEVLMYLDPPYWVTLEQTKYYELAKGFTHYHHMSMATSLAKECKAKWIISYDDVPEVVDLYKEFNIIRLSAKYSSGHIGQEKVCTELIITNYKTKLPQLDMFDETGISTEEVTDEDRVDAEFQIKLKTEQELENQIKDKKQHVFSRETRKTEQSNLFS